MYWCECRNFCAAIIFRLRCVDERQEKINFRRLVEVINMRDMDIYIFSHLSPDVVGVKSLSNHMRIRSQALGQFFHWFHRTHIRAVEITKQFSIRQTWESGNSMRLQRLRGTECSMNCHDKIRRHCISRAFINKSFIFIFIIDRTGREKELLNITSTNRTHSLVSHEIKM